MAKVPEREDGLYRGAGLIGCICKGNKHIKQKDKWGSYRMAKPK